MPIEHIRKKSYRNKIRKFSIINAIIALAFSAAHLLEVIPQYNGTLLAIVLVTTTVAAVSALLLYVHPINDWNHDGT